jgi:hypothetical protein
MERPKHRTDTRVCTSPMDTSARADMAFVVKLPIRTVRTVPPPEALDMGRDRPRLPSVPTTGLKPMADETRKAPPFGSPKGEGRHDQSSKRSTGGVASSQVDPPQGGTHAQRHGRGRDRSPLRLLECMDGPASPVSVLPRAALREVRLNGSPGALAEVPWHRIGGRGRRVPDAPPTGGSDAAYFGQPAYPVSYTGAGEGWRTPPLRSPRSSRSRGGRGRGLRPPSPVPVRRDA